MLWYFEPLEEDMWSQEGLFKTDEEYIEELIKTRSIKYRKDPFLNTLNTSIEFEVATSPGGGSEGYQKETRYIEIIDDLFELEATGRFQPPTLANLPSSTHSISQSPFSQEGKKPGEVCHRGGFVAEDGYVAPNDPFLKMIGVKKSLIGSRVSEGSDRESQGSEQRFTKKKSWKSRRNNTKMVLGRDVGLKEVSSLSLLALVGNFSYWACSMAGYWKMDRGELETLLRVHS
jgi:hypothetical protein